MSFVSLFHRPNLEFLILIIWQVSVHLVVVVVVVCVSAFVWWEDCSFVPMHTESYPSWRTSFESQTYSIAILYTLVYYLPLLNAAEGKSNDKLISTPFFFYLQFFKVPPPFHFKIKTNKWKNNSNKPWLDLGLRSLILPGVLRLNYIKWDYFLYFVC